jgi:hypothetical protein
VVVSRSEKSICFTNVQESAAQRIGMNTKDLASLPGSSALLLPIFMVYSFFIQNYGSVYFYSSPFLCSELWLIAYMIRGTSVIKIASSDGNSRC